MIDTIENYARISFIPTLYKNCVNMEKIDLFISAIPKSIEKVGRYVDIKGISFFFIDKKYSKKIKKELSLDKKISAATVGTQILFFSNYLSNKRYACILDHELFHAGVYQCIGNSKTVPIWFNEAVAYFIGDNCKYNTRKLKTYVQKHFADIAEWIISNSLFLSCPYSYQIIKSIGNYFCARHSPDVIKSILCESAISQDFSASFEKILGYRITTLINDWQAVLMTMD